MPVISKSIATKSALSNSGRKVDNVEWKFLLVTSPMSVVCWVIGVVVDPAMIGGVNWNWDKAKDEGGKIEPILLEQSDVADEVECLTRLVEYSDVFDLVDFM